MPYDERKRPPFMETETDVLADRCAAIAPGAGDQVDAAGRYFKYFMAATAGDVTFVPMKGDDATTHTVTVAAGQILQGRIRRVTASTATLIGWFD